MTVQPLAPPGDVGSWKGTVAAEQEIVHMVPVRCHLAYDVENGEKKM